MQNDEYWMQQALALASTAAKNDEVPVGAVLVYGDKLLGSGFNRCIMDCDPTAHAEIVALRQAANTLGNYRLLNTTLYVNLEPCVMCLGALLHARIARVVFGATDPKTGAIIGKLQLLAQQWNHKIQYTAGVLSSESARLLQDFFKARR